MFSKTINSGKNARVLVWTTTSQRKSASNPKAIQQTHQADLSHGDTHSPFAGGGGDDDGDRDTDDALNNTDSGGSDGEVNDDDGDMMVTVMTKMVMIMEMLLIVLAVTVMEMMAKTITVTIAMMEMMMTITCFGGREEHQLYARNWAKCFTRVMLFDEIIR